MVETNNSALCGHDGYRAAMTQVRKGLSENIWTKGDRRQKLEFAENCFAARIMGAEEHARTGQPHMIPDVFEQNGGLCWGMSVSTAESVRTKSVSNRYEQSLERFGHLMESKSGQEDEPSF